MVVKEKRGRGEVVMKGKGGSERLTDRTGGTNEMTGRCGGGTGRKICERSVSKKNVVVFEVKSRDS